MGKKLAIQGHAIRGEEVIELLEMLGGVAAVVKGTEESYCYYISENTATKHIFCDYIGPEEIDKYEIFTLEEFWEKYPFKVEDKVMGGKGKSLTIKSMSWSTDCETMVYDFEETEDVLAAEDLFKWNAVPTNKETDKMKLGDSECERTHEDAIFDSIIWHLRNSVNNGEQNLSGGECEDYFREVVKKNNENKMKNVLAELLEHIKTTPKEDLEREFEEIKEWSNVGPTVEEFKTFCECVNKKPTYPKTVIEVLEYWHPNREPEDDYQYIYKKELIKSFQLLLYCRDAYWKIAGEQMGLGKPWEPDWNDGELKWCMSYSGKYIEFDRYKFKHHILVFPTEEMRDAFYENFKDLIEHCKELL